MIVCRTMMPLLTDCGMCEQIQLIINGFSSSVTPSRGRRAGGLGKGFGWPWMLAAVLM